MTSQTWDASDSWTCPGGVSSVQVQAWGPGGRGADGGTGSPARAGGGGGGGEYASATVTVHPGGSYSFTIGTGGSSTSTVFTGDSGQSVTAHPGGNGSGISAGAKGTGSTASTHHDGGAGGAGWSGISPGGAGGGSSAGTGANGGNGTGGSTGGAGGTAPSGGGDGGDGGASAGVDGSPGTAPGGGGGGGRGAQFSATSGGAGADGRITLTWTVTGTTVTPGSADGAGAGLAATTSASRTAWPGTAPGAGEAGDGTQSASQAVTAETATAGTAADGPQVLTPYGGFPGPADGAGEAPDPGWAADAIALPGPASGGGQAPDPGGLAGVIAYPDPADAVGSAADGGTAVTITAVAGVAGGASGVSGGTAYTLSYGQAPGNTASGAGEAPTPVIFAYAQPVYLGASGGTGRPAPLPGGSQVSVAAPGGTAWTYLGHLGHVQDLVYSFVMPGGADKLTCTLKLPASLRSGVLTAGWHVRVQRGGHTVWTGRLDEPQPGPDGWQVTAAGDGQRGSDFAAIYSGTWPAGQPDDLVNQAIARGLGWQASAVGQPAWLWTGQAPDPGSATVASALSQMCARGGGTWYVSSQPDGRPRLSLLPVPVTVSRLLLVTVPVSRTLSPLVNRLVIRYQATADTTGGSGAPASYGLTTVTSTADVAVHDVTEDYLDLSSAGVMTAAAAQAAGTSVLSLYRAAAYAGPFTASPGQLLTTGGVPVDPGCDQAGTVCRLIVSDFGYGGEVTPAVPVTFCVGGYEWNDQAGVATLTPYQASARTLADLAAAAG